MKPKTFFRLWPAVALLLCGFAAFGCAFLKGKVSDCLSDPNSCVPPPTTIPPPVPPTTVPASPKPEPAPSASPSASPVPVPSPSPTECPAGQHRSAVGIPAPGSDVVCVPDVVPTECKTPQLTSDSWEIVNWGGDASRWPARETFVGFGDPPGVVLQEIMAVTHCGLKANPCPTRMGAQAFHAEIARRLRARGFCAGQHEDGVSDMIVVSTNPPLDGLWLEVHQVCGSPGKEIACWGKIDKATTLWRVKGTGTPLPSPDPSAPPSPAPSPKPTPPPVEHHDPPTIDGGPTTLHKGQTATLRCKGSEPGWPITQFIASGPTGTNGMKKGHDWDFNRVGSNALMITVLGGAQHFGTIHSYCVLRETTDITHVESRNFSIQAVP